MFNSDELIVTTENLTLYTSCRIHRCRYKRVRLYFEIILFFSTRTVTHSSAY